MNPLELRQIGRTDVRVTSIGFGGGTLGDLWEVIPEAQADATVAAAWEGGIFFIAIDIKSLDRPAASVLDWVLCIVRYRFNHANRRVFPQ